MSEPIVFISHSRIKEGKLDGFKQYNRPGAEWIEANKPDTVAFLVYVNEDGTEVSIIHVFPDGDAMSLHMQGVGDRAKGAYEFLEPVSIEIYGTPTEAVLEMMKQITGSGVALSLNPQSLGGYIRLTSG